MKVETARLLDKAEHAIRAAEILLDADEGDFAAGRAYYAMFYVAEALLVERGRRFRKHSAVHAAFGARPPDDPWYTPRFGCGHLRYLCFK